MSFDASLQASRVIGWIKYYMFTNIKTLDTPILIGMSGGKDSTIVAQACIKAWGAHRVIGFSLPDYGQSSDKALQICEDLGIKCHVFPIGSIVSSMYSQMKDLGIGDDPTNTVLWNHPARIRMAILYMCANQLGGRVANTCNMSETYVGYDTRWGDQCGDFSPFQMYTATELKAIGRELGVPDKWVDQVPSDGMCGQSDEERWGFTYDTLDRYLRGDRSIDPDTVKKIEMMHRNSLFKTETISLPCLPYRPHLTEK